MYMKRQIGIPSNVYKTPKGNEYTFFDNVPLEVVDKEDIAYFLKKGAVKCKKNGEVSNKEDKETINDIQEESEVTEPVEGEIIE